MIVLWLEALRVLAAARVESTRRRWLDRGRPATVHDVVDEILAGDEVERDDDALVAARDALTADPRWRRLAAELDVPPRELELLALLAVCELAPRFTRVLGYLDDAVALAPPTPAVAALLWGWPPGYQPGPACALARWQLAGPTGPWQSTTPWTIDGDIAAFVAGDEHWADFYGAVTVPDLDGMESLHPELLEQMRAAASVVTLGCEIELIGAPGSGRRTLLAQLATATGRNAIVLHGGDQVRALRTARLMGAVPIWVDDERADGHAVGVDTTPGAITAVARAAPAAASPPGIIRLSWVIPAVGPEARQRLWSARTAGPPPRIVRDWALSPADIEMGAAAGPALATTVLRRRLRAATMESMTAVDCCYERADLIVPDQVGEQLDRLRNQVLLARDVLDDWEFGRLHPNSTGLTALFAGPSGTGKTMAAQVLARELDFDLYRVDLAQVVDKYIGETEKRLSAVFDQCERSNVMVLFDEADALFGRRTRVRDAHDRYANIQIDYLLQRLDTFRGVAVLATNRKSDLDDAFLRRLRIVVDFLPPATAERLRLWRRVLPAKTSAGAALTRDLDHDWLATHLELTGAEIVAIALAAAFDARERGELIGTAHVVDAARRELVKRGTVLRLETPLAVAR